MIHRTSADTAEAHLRRAVHWQRYRQADLARGSLRLWSLAGGVPEALSVRAPGPGLARKQIQLARIELHALVRTRCAALRALLSAEAAVLSGRGIGAFEGRVLAEARRVAAELDRAVSGRLSEMGMAADPGALLRVENLLPPRRRPRLENRLIALFGIGFGAGLSLTAGRLLGQLRPDWMPAAGLACGLLGVALTAWSVGARLLLAERTAAERWMLEVLANLRPALEERVLIRMLLADSAAAAERLRDTPN